MNTPHKSTIVVIGAGLAGLSAAYTLKKAGYNVVVLERGSYVGGRILTKNIDTFNIERGAQFLVGFYENTRKLLEELGLNDELTEIKGHAAVFKFHKVVEFWYDLRFILSPIISLGSKIKMLNLVPDLLKYWSFLDIHNFPKAYPVDCKSVSEYSSTKLGFEIVEYLLYPILSGIFYWTPENTSLALLLMLGKVAPKMKLFTLRHGLGQLPVALAKHLNLSLNSSVENIEQKQINQFVVKFRRDGNDEFLIANGIVCATTAKSVKNIFTQISSNDMDFFDSVDYATTVTTSLRVNKRASKNIYGIFFPRAEKEIKHLASVTVESAKNASQFDGDVDFISLFSTDQSGKILINETDKVISENLMQDLTNLGPAYQYDKPDIVGVYRWNEAVPLFDVGHFRRLNEFISREIVKKEQLVFAGDYIGGPFIEGAITSGIMAANRLISKMESSEEPTHK